MSGLSNELTGVYICPYPGVGGTQEYTLLLARRMLEIQSSILVMPFDEAQSKVYKEPFLKLGGQIMTLPEKLCVQLSKRNYFSRLMAGYKLGMMLNKLLADKRGHIILHSSLNPIAAALLAILFGDRGTTINVFHDFGDLNKRSVSYYLNSILLRLLPDDKLGFIVPSGHVKRQLTKWVASLNPDRVRVIPTGIEPIADIKSDAMKFNDPPVFYMLGRVDRAKAPEVWIEAAAKYLRQGKAAKFIWIGTGPKLSECKQQVPEDLREQIVFSGWVEDADALIATSDIFILSSRWEGGNLPRSVLEAMYKGFPCILPKLPSITEALAGGEFACFYDPENVNSLADACAKVAGNFEHCKSYSAKSRELVLRNHTADAEFSMTYDYYLDMINA